ncbi:MAG: DUF6382 domain-containing protein [Lachnospiraceae bacterium]|nr:DUF6382 domain-containing protein [Lachnospiraceae bacterium]
MDVSYQRSPNRSYMILSGEESGESYEEEMLRQNAVTLLLSFYMVEIDQGVQVWYDITRLRSVRDIVKQEGVTLENLYMFLNGIATAFSMLSQYLISQQNILIAQDAVYFDRETPPNVRLCYCPLKHDDYETQLSSTMSFFMDEVDTDKEEITQLVYRLYEMCQDPVTLEELVDAVRREMPENTLAEPMIEDVNQGEFVPSAERTISERKTRAMEPEIEPETVIPKKPVKRWDQISLMQKIKNFFLEKFPVLAKADREKKKQEEDKGERAHDFTQDFVFDPDTELLTKTVFMRPDEEKTSVTGFQGVLIYDGKGAEVNYHIKTDSFRIGSQDGENEAVLHSKVVSRHHAVITRSDGDFFIEDLNSTNGTYLNGTLLPYHDRIKLSKMDKIVFADVAYHFI